MAQLVWHGALASPGPGFDPPPPTTCGQRGHGPRWTTDHGRAHQPKTGTTFGTKQLTSEKRTEGQTGTDRSGSQQICGRSRWKVLLFFFAFRCVVGALLLQLSSLFCPDQIMFSSRLGYLHISVLSAILFSSHLSSLGVSVYRFQVKLAAVLRQGAQVTSAWSTRGRYSKERWMYAVHVGLQIRRACCVSMTFQGACLNHSQVS